MTRYLFLISFYRQGKYPMNLYSRFNLKNTLIILFIALLCGCNSQKDEPSASDMTKINFEEYCKTHECRKDLKFGLKTEGDNFFDFSTRLAEPVVQDSIDKSDASGKKKN